MASTTYSENFSDFAPSYVLDFLRVITKTGCMAIVGGETGSGKTEFMKLMLSFISFSRSISRQVMEDQTRTVDQSLKLVVKRVDGELARELTQLIAALNVGSDPQRV